MAAAVQPLFGAACGRATWPHAPARPGPRPWLWVSLASSQERHHPAMPLGLGWPRALWPRWACRPLHTRAGAGADAGATTAPASIQVQRSAGSGPQPWPRTLGPTSSSWSSTEQGVDIETEVRAPRPAPAPPRAQRPCPHAGPSAHACAALRPHFTVPVPAPPLPCPRRVAPHTPSTPPALRARALGPRAC